MIIQPKNTTIAYRCPACGQAVKSMVGVFALSGDMIKLCPGDAAEVLPTLTKEYDMIFMDAAKGQYLSFLPEVLRLLKCGGILLTDNVLQEGDVMESRYAVCRRDRTIHSRMRDYLYKLTHDEDYSTSIIPLADGAALSVRLGT